MKNFLGFRLSCAGLAAVLVCLHGAAAEMLQEKAGALEPLT
jgi:hypothetical protein